MNQHQLKEMAARAALESVETRLHPGMVLGIGTGSTADLFIDALASIKSRFAAAVASSDRSAARLASHGIRVMDLNDVEDLPIYIDGADEIDGQLSMIKGGGGALTREKIVAAVARSFLCIADESKLVSCLGRFPLPVEVIPMASRYVGHELTRIAGSGCSISLRREPGGQAFHTDNGNVILDVTGLVIHDPRALEREIDQIVGVVTNGLFAARGADELVLATASGIRKLRSDLDT